MAVIKPEQLSSGSYNITGSFYGTSSFALTASYVAGGSGITIGSTPLTSGASTRILYQSGSVIQQSSNLTYDGGQVLNIGNSTTGYVKTDTDNNSGVLAGTLGTYSVNNYPLVKLTSTFTSTYADGKLSLYRGNTETVQLYASSTGGRLTGVDSVYIKAAGALSTDIAFRVRNSSDTENGFQYNGDGTYRLGGLGGDTYTKAFTHISDGRMFMAQTGVNFIELNPSTTQHRFYFPSNGVEINTDTRPSSFAMSNSTQYTFYQGGVQYGNGIFAVSGAPTRYFLTQNGTAPSENFTDRHWYYSADITAGNAAPHFRTENGSIIKLYKEIQPSLSGSANTGNPATDALIEAMKTIILNLGFGASS